MDSMKRKRTQFHREFTIAADALEEALQREEDPKGHAATFFDCADTLFGCEAALRDLWCDDSNFEENEFQKYQDTALKYKMRYSQLKSKLSSNKTNDHSWSTSTSPTMKTPRHGEIHSTTDEPKEHMLLCDGNKTTREAEYDGILHLV
ncbi:hypothetical protein ACJJTC_000788 [Scirpophaga incertulas]